MQWLDALLVLLLNLTALCLISSAIGACVMKYFVRQQSYKTHFIIFLWAIARVMFVVVIALFIMTFKEISLGPLSGLASFLGMVAVGFLITRNLKSYGVTSSKFPGVGAKTMMVLFMLMWLVVGGVWLVTTF